MYDYIIVGAGSAGCVLSHRLTEDPSVDVLLLESGEPANHRDDVLDVNRVWEVMGSELDWCFETEPQPGLDGRSIEWPRGKALGGSSVINGTAYVRGHPEDFNNWERQGNDGWGYEDLLPYFKKFENFNGDGDDAYHATGGPLSVERRGSTDAFTERLIDAGIEAGMERNPDFNGERQAGIGYYDYTTKEEERHSAAAAFIKPVLDRDNLHVETSAHVTSLAFDGDRASGVVYEQDGGQYEESVGADGEVILSAGAIQSPQLLMLSGIGPTDHLDAHDIDVRVDLPGVGRNLQDHLRMTTVYRSPEPIPLEDPDDADTRHDRSLIGAFEELKDDVRSPEVQYGMNAGGVDPTNEIPEGFSITSLPLRPTSRGRVTLQSTDPYDDPIMDPEYLSTDRDVKEVIDCIRRSREIAETGPLSEFYEEEVMPGPDVQTDEEILQFVADTVESGYHPTCTCKMGNDDMAVVDDRLRVYGVDNLRVIDASIMPQVTSGNTNAPTYAIAERGADLLKGVV